MRRVFSTLTGLTLTVLLTVLCLAPSSFAANEKAEDIVAKHLESIGTAQARAAALSRVVEGKADVKLLVGGAGNLEGKSVLVSQGDKLQFMMKFPNNDYRGEQFICDGKKVQVTGTTANHGRSSFGAFVLVNDFILRDGLFGGALSTAWSLENLPEHKAKLSYEGLKKIDGQQLYELRYRPKKSTDVDVRLYFDPQTFHHVMTVYSAVQGAGLGNVDSRFLSAVPADSSKFPVDTAGVTPTGGIVQDSNETLSARQQQTRYRLEEHFSDFQTANGLTLPTHYRIEFTQELQSGKTTVSQWDVTTQEIMNGKGVDPRNFQVK
jgi:hypothetical protein